MVPANRRFWKFLRERASRIEGKWRCGKASRRVRRSRLGISPGRERARGGAPCARADEHGTGRPASTRGGEPGPRRLSEFAAEASSLPADGESGWRSQKRWCRIRTFCCWMSRQIIWTWQESNGWKSCCENATLRLRRRQPRPLFSRKRGDRQLSELNRAYPDGLFSRRGNYSTFLEERRISCTHRRNGRRRWRTGCSTEIEWLRRGPKARAQKRKRESTRRTR